ncbi:MAG: hypothetical protein HY696_08250 [Deltaproteobacteria bacterium]|nr:hypothetical protein [Deltaproteobacteria bacterium]
MRRFALLLVGLLPLTLGVKQCESGRVSHPAVAKDQACSECHDDGRSRATRPQGHDSAWEKDHGNWIRQSGLKTDSTCLVCHNESHCSTCHQQEAPRDHTEWWRVKGHAVTSVLDRTRCFSCHRGADFCQRCHANTAPITHTAAWGSSSNQHCLNCHWPLSSAGAQNCAVCHASAPSHATAPTRPLNALHGANANCRQCHTPLRHADNGQQCTTCHTQ